MPLKLLSDHEKSKKEDVSKKTTLALEEARDSFIESAGKISANMLGMVSKVGGQIYALLWLSRKPMSLDEIMEALKLSKGNISVNVRMLEGFGLAKKVWVKGTRRDYYEANRDYPRKFLKNFFDRVRSGIDDSLRVINLCKKDFEHVASDISADVPPSSPAAGEGVKEDADFMVSQLFLLEAFYQAASRLFDDFYQGRTVNMDLLRQVILE